MKRFHFFLNQILSVNVREDDRWNHYACTHVSLRSFAYPHNKFICFSSLFFFSMGDASMEFLLPNLDSHQRKFFVNFMSCKYLKYKYFLWLLTLLVMKSIVRFNNLIYQNCLFTSSSCSCESSKKILVNLPENFSF